MDLVKFPPLLLPKKEYLLHSWAVVACDQFTSEPEYWASVEKITEGFPSTLKLMLPEIYLGNDEERRMKDIYANMRAYINNGIFREINPGIVALKRFLSPGVVRRGVVVSFDLEMYSYKPEDNAAVRATERTIEERLPARVEIRRNAALELPHIMALVDDPGDTFMNTVFSETDELLYEGELNMGGGRVEGYSVKNIPAVTAALNKLTAESLAKYGYAVAIGDGNHSLAAAKVLWEQTKVSLSEKERETHPLMFALAEIVNIYDGGLTFQPIHRLVTGAEADFLAGLKLPLPEASPDAAEYVDAYIAGYLKTHPRAKVDYIHGESALRELAKAPGAYGIEMPLMDKSTFFAEVNRRGVLPKKTFSMGEANEKRYYMEARKIR